MALPRQDSTPLPDAATDVLDPHVDLLVMIAVQKFKVPPEDANALIHDILISYLRKQGEIDDVRPWLVAAMCNASRHYWRSRGKSVVEGVATPLLPQRGDRKTAKRNDSSSESKTLRDALEGFITAYRILE